MINGIRTKDAYRPPCWQDDIRMNALFSVFRNESVNPEGYRDKMDFWVHSIVTFCEETKTVIVSHDDLCHAFERNGHHPQCLNEVLEFMARQGTITTRDEFERNRMKTSWLGWGYNVLVHKPVSWGLSTVQNALSWGKQEKKYVVTSVVRDIASSILQRCVDVADSEKTDNAVFLKHLKQQCGDICDGESFRLALMQLQQERSILIVEIFGQQVIKFRRNQADDLKPISELDQGVLRLKNANSIVLKEMDKMELEITSCTEEAKHLVKNGFKTKAMIALKKRKRLEMALQKKTVVQDNIETLLNQLQNTGSERMVLDAYNAGAATIKLSMKKDFDLDNIDKIMANFEEAMEDFGDVQDTISKFVVPQNSDLDLELELEQILAEESISIEGMETPPKDSASRIPLEDAKKYDTMTPEQIDQDIMKRLIALRVPADVSPVAAKSSPKVAPISNTTT